MANRPVHSRGFTLIELILVMIIISIMVAVATPSLRGWGQGQKLRNAADSFLAATGYARSQAVTTAMPYAVGIDSTANSFTVECVQPDGTRKPAGGDFGEKVTLPESFTIRLVSGGDTGQLIKGVTASGAAGGTGPSILFYPDARGTPAVVEFKAPLGDTIQLASESPADPFRKVEAAK